MRGLAELQDSLQLPAGTVTFLLSDIEGSTRMWESHADAMAVAVPRHYELLADAVERRGGVRPVEQGEGDSVVAAFARASNALQAALDAQRALHAERWPEGVELHVRIALHTAEAEPRDAGVYRGVALSRCARLRAVAHGGQTLLSRTTRDLVADHLPDGAELVHLGRQRLRDLGRPEDVFCLVHADLPREFAPPRSLDGLPNNLPEQLTSFVGRETELEEVARELAKTRLLTLTGAGGCGKTRLALQAAADALERWPEGAWWVELAHVSDPELLSAEIAGAIGIRPLPGMSEFEAVIAHLAPRCALVLLDNCEHLLDECARVVEALIRGCPGLAVMATSRAALGVPGETEWRVPSLSLPEDFEVDAIDLLGRSDAARLFMERAIKVRPNFEVTSEKAAALAAICRELDGIPLAIELAAARVRSLSVDQIAEGLEDRFRLLTGGARTALARQRTLRASVEWSHAPLSQDEQTLFRRLAVFAGGFTLGAAEQVCSERGLGRGLILDLLASLVEKSLVQADQADREVRYRLLETLRQYALERLQEAGELRPLRDSHRDAYLAFAGSVESGLTTADQPTWLDLLDREAANLTTALEWAAESQPDKALTMCVALTPWWRLRGLFGPGEAAYRRALERADPQGSPGLYARVLAGRAYLFAYAGQRTAAVQAAESALMKAERLGDGSTMARALNAMAIANILPDPLGCRSGLERACELAAASGDDWCLVNATEVLAYTYLFQEDYDALRRVLNEVVPVIKRLGDVERWAWHWFGMGYSWYASGDHATCEEFLERALTAARAVREPTSEGCALAFLELREIHAGRAERALGSLAKARQRAVTMGAGLTLPWIEVALAEAEAALGELESARSRLHVFVEAGAGGALHALLMAEVLRAEILRLLGDPDGATECCGRALEIAGQLGNPWYAAKARLVLGRLAAARREWSDAEHLHHEALATVVERNFTLDLPLCLEALAEVAAGLESHEEAARILGAAHSVRRQLCLVAWKPQRANLVALDQRIRDAIGEAEFAAAFDKGAALQRDDALVWVRRARGSRKRPSGGWESLTPTELEVVRLAAQGLTNAETGARLFISPGTVKVHLSHIYAKLGVRNRAELTREAARRLPAQPS